MFHAVCYILYAVSTQLVVVVCPGDQLFTLTWLTCLNLGCLWKYNGSHCNLKEPPAPPKIFKMSPGDPQNLQNGLQNGAWNHQIPEIVEKVKSNENHSIYCVFERSGHWKTDYFPFRIHQGIWLQCRSAFCDSKTQKVSKSDSKLAPAGTPKSIKNLKKTTLGPMRVSLSASLTHLINKILPNRPQRSQCDPKSLQTCLQNCTWKWQNMDIPEKVASSESNHIYCVFEKLGHWTPDKAQCKNHQGSCLQCRSAYCEHRS